MSFTLKEILDLVGKIDDKEGNNTPKDRFRNFLKKIEDIGQIRDYIEEYLRNSTSSSISIFYHIIRQYFYLLLGCWF